MFRLPSGLYFSACLDSQKGAKGTKVLHFAFRAIWYNCYNVQQQMHTLCYNYSNILTYILHISGLNGPISGRAQSYITIFRPYYHLQYVELYQFLRCLVHRDEYVYSICSSTVNTLKHRGCSNYCAHIRLYKPNTEEIDTVPEKVATTRIEDGDK